MAARISSGPGPVVRNLVCPGALGCTGDEMEVCVNFNNIDLGLFVEHVGVCDLSSAVCDLTAAERALYVGFCEESCESESDFYFVDAAAAQRSSQQGHGLHAAVERLDPGRCAPSLRPHAFAAARAVVVRGIGGDP
mgnify:CR=1 FL=1